MSKIIRAIEYTAKSTGKGFPLTIRFGLCEECGALLSPEALQLHVDWHVRNGH
jgi:hypothetical protein